MLLFLEQLLNGVQLGMTLFLMAAGPTLVFGVMNFINLAHGSLFMAGAYVAAFIVAETGSFLTGLVAGVAGAALFGVLLDRLIVRRLEGRDHLDQVLATVGLILVFDTLAHLVWGPEGISIPLPGFLRGQVTILPGVIFPSYRLVIIAAGLIVAGGLYWLIGHTRLGMLIRAGASNRVMVSALGVDIQTLFTAVFALGAVLAGLAGMLIAPITEASIGMGNDIIITAFVVIIIGGIGSMKGAFVAALIIGLIDTLGRSFLDDLLKLVIPVAAAETAGPAIASMLIYILMASILAIRPAGLFPPRVR